MPYKKFLKTCRGCKKQKIIRLNAHHCSKECYLKNSSGKFHKKHGMSRTRFYKIWIGVVERGLQKKYIKKRYKKPWIKLCINWLKFENFRDDMRRSYLGHCKKFGERNTTIDRINNTKGYSKKNCKWSTYREQNQNKSNARIIEFNNKKQNLAEWARRVNLKRTTLLNRLNSKWPIEQALYGKLYKRRKI